MLLSPTFGGNRAQITADSVVIVTDPDDQKRVDFLVSRCALVTGVQDDHSLTLARRLGGEVKAMLDEILTQKKLVKGPLQAIEHAVEARAKEISEPLLKEKARIAALLGAYVSRLEAAKKAEQQRREAALQAQVNEQQQRLKEAEEAKLKAEAEARAAPSEAERLTARQRAQNSLAIAAQAQLAQEMAQEAAKIGSDKPVRGKIPGGRVNYNYDYKVVNVRTLLEAGFFRLLRWEVDKRACNDEVRAQLDKDPDAEPKIPGIEITKTVNVSLKPTARIQ
jgi:regulator of protease activity HflC (stomatin/prohibitin superfamily)